ncbi:MAG TPA: beta-galactosidase [Candidatus Pullilachnospira intestinigallinarum]|nr:beta-galactosidase [Candidatus Pullilachnospira intestinigallinarum]
MEIEVTRENSQQQEERKRRMLPLMETVGSYGANGYYLTKDGKPWYPVMGEIHFSRLSEYLWRDAVAKMKAGGVQILATYVFWIHHEERQGEWDFSGQRNLRKFLAICRQEHLPVFLRIGPWCHGECRNGGFPDWLEKREDLRPRTNDPAYLDLVEKYWRMVYRQAEGFFYDQGGPIVGVQIENEYGHCGGLQGKAGREHMRTLKELAIRLGFQAPYYTATGWGGGIVPEGFLPVLAAYCGAPWDSSREQLPLNGNFLFTHYKDDRNVGSDLHVGEETGFTYDTEKLPYLTAELGGGLQVTGHRRPFVTGADTAAMALCKFGSGANLLGYYMYHGGTNPEGKDSTLQESAATGSPNELPVWSYDFQAPVGEFGRIHESFYDLRPLHLFLKDFGHLAAQTDSVLPRWNASVPEDSDSLRAALRHLTGKEMGFLCYNGHQRHGSVRERTSQFEIRENGHTAQTPPLHLKADGYGIFPYATEESGGLPLTFDFRVFSSNLQPLCALGSDVVFFGEEEPEIVWDGTGEAICISSREAAHGLKYPEEGQERLFTAEGCLMEEQGKLILLTEHASNEVKIYPQGETEIHFCREVQPAGTLLEVAEGEDYVEYEIQIRGEKTEWLNDLWIRLELSGDRAELYLDGKMCRDWFCQGKPWDLSWRDLGYSESARVRVYPAKNPGEVYYEVPQEGKTGIRQMKLIPEYRLVIRG